MAHYYVKPETGGGSPVGTGTSADPFNGFGNIPSLSNGDVVELTAGTFTEELTLQDKSVTIQGQGWDTTIIDGEDTRTTCITVSSDTTGRTLVKDLAVTRGAENGIRCRNNLIQDYQVTVQKVKCYDLTQNTAAPGKCTGFVVRNQNNVTVDVRFVDCIAYDCGRIGFDTQEFQGYIEYRRCTAYRCGSLGTGGGFYTHPWRGSPSADWTDEGGGIYSNTKNSSLDGSTGGAYNTGGSQELFKVSATPTSTPASGEISRVGTTIYINPALAFSVTDHITMSRADMSGLIIDCFAYDNGGFDTEHGTGFHLDEFSDRVDVVRCRAVNNGGKGFRSYWSSNIGFYHCLAVGNGHEGGVKAQKSNFHLVGFDNVIRYATSVDPTGPHVTASFYATTDVAVVDSIFVGGVDVIYTPNFATLFAFGVMTYGYSGLLEDEDTGTIVFASLYDNVNPMLMNNYQLPCDSPAIGLGSTTEGYDDYDSLSGIRPSDLTRDLGANQTFYGVEFQQFRKRRIA